MPYRRWRVTPLILVADDDEMQRFLCREALESSGYEIIEAGDGATALAAFADAKPDLVLLDVLMPEMNGFDTCRAIRAMPLGGTTPVLMATGLDDIRSIELSYEAGATDFIGKPINWALLPHRVRYLLRADEVMSHLVLSEQLLAEAQRIAAIGNFRWSPHSPDVRRSAEAARIFGDDNPAEPKSMRALLRRIAATDRARLMRAFRHARLGDIIQLDLQIFLPAGDMRYISLRAEVIHDEHGRNFVQGTVQDITDRKRIELALQIARDNAEAADAGKTAFLAAMSHEFRTPLHAIIGFAELISKQAFGQIGNERYLEFTRNIMTAGERLLDTVTDVLTIAQLESGVYQLSQDSFDLCELARSVVASFRQSAMATEREMLFDAAAESMEVFADQRAVAQMLFKLLSNAAKFSDAATPISVRLDQGLGGNCRLTVEDRGVGMSAEEADLAVQPFRQVDNRLAREFEGTGLGLSITKKLMELHGGNIEIVSARQRGTRVILTFARPRIDLTEVQRGILVPERHAFLADFFSRRHPVVSLNRTVPGAVPGY